MIVRRLRKPSAMASIARISTVRPVYRKSPQRIVSLRALHSPRFTSHQKSNCAPILKKRDCSTLVGRSHWLELSVEKVLVAVNGQLLLNTL